MEVIMTEQIVVKYVGSNPLVQKHEGDAGMDLRSVKRIVLTPMERIVVPTNLYVEIPIGYEGQVRPRSGMSIKHGVTVINAPGTIDAGYRGEVGVALINLNCNYFVIEIGDRIAQLVICPVANVFLVKAETREELSDTTRGDGGFGSTGHS